jgi:hypothetical protein
MRIESSSKRGAIAAFIVTLSCVANASAQIGGPLCAIPLPPTTWTAQVLGSPADDEAQAVAVDDGVCSIYVGGETFGTLSPSTVLQGVSDAFLARYSTTGALVWLSQIGTTGAEGVLGIAVDTDHSLYVVGYTNGMMPGSPVFNLGLNDIWLARYDQDGVQQWVRQLGSPGNDVPRGVAISDTGEVYITGTTTGGLLGLANAGGIDYFLARYDTSGTLLMLTQRGTTADDYARGLAIGPGGNVWVVGNTEGALGAAAFGGPDVFLAKYDSAGTEIWVQQRGTTENDQGNAVAVNADGQAFVVGMTTGDLDGHVNAGWSDLFIMRFDANGTWRWTDQRGTITNDVAYAVKVDASGAPRTIGASVPGLDGATGVGWPSDVFVIKHGRGGAWRWTALHGTTDSDHAWAAAIDGRDNVYAAGQSDGAFGSGVNAGGFDAFVIKFDGAGAVR